MTVHTSPTQADGRVGEGHAAPDRALSAPRVPSGRLGRITVVSMAGGAATALALPMVVFTGSAEHVITGTALIGLALGWALLAVLSTRLTTQPQRWACVPAVTLAAAGVGLLLLAPDDDALTRAGWFWPPVMLAVAAWAAVHARRSLRNRARAWLVYPAVGLLGLAAVGGGYQTYRVTTDATAVPMPGKSWDVGDHDLHLVCAGQGSPTVVLENGLGGTSVLWSRVTEQISATTRVCAYDRAGQGWSEPAGEAHDGLAVAADLHALLREAGETGPYVVAGHSSGGVYAMAYAARYPQDVAALVLLDAPNPYTVTATSATTTVPSSAAGPVGLIPTLGRIGLAQLAPTQFWSSLPEPHASQMRALAATARSMSAAVQEVSQYPAAFGQAQALTTLGDTPLVVVTTTEKARAADARYAAQERFASLSTNGSLRVASTTHAGLLEDERGAEHSIGAIQDVVRAVRSGGAVTDS